MAPGDSQPAGAAAAAPTAAAAAAAAAAQRPIGAEQAEVLAALLAAQHEEIARVAFAYPSSGSHDVPELFEAAVPPDAKPEEVDLCGSSDDEGGGPAQQQQQQQQQQRRQPDDPAAQAQAMAQRQQQQTGGG